MIEHAVQNNGNPLFFGLRNKLAKILLASEKLVYLWLDEDLKIGDRYIQETPSDLI